MNYLRHRLLTSVICVTTMTPATLAPLAVLPLAAAIEAVVLTPLGAPPALATIPVIDVTSIGVEIQQVVNQLKSYVVDINNYLANLNSYFTEETQLITQIKQLATLIDQYTEIVYMAVNFIGHPNFNAILGILALAGINLNSLPLNAYAMEGVLSGLKSGTFFSNWQGVPGQLGSLFNTTSTTNQIYRCTDTSFNCVAQQQHADANAGYSAAAQQVYSDIQPHTTALDALRSTALANTDPKTISQVGVEAAIETAWAVNNATRMTAIGSLAQAQYWAMEQEAAQMRKQEADTYLAAVPP